MDASSDMLDMCQQRFKGRKIDYIAAYFQDLAFKEGEFDLIVATLSLHHLKSEEKQAIFPRIFCIRSKSTGKNIYRNPKEMQKI